MTSWQYFMVLQKGLKGIKKGLKGISFIQDQSPDATIVGIMYLELQPIKYNEFS